MGDLFPGDGGPGPSWPGSTLRLARFYLAHPQPGPRDPAVELLRWFLAVPMPSRIQERAGRALRAGSPALGYTTLVRGFVGDSPHPDGSDRRSRFSNRSDRGGIATALPQR